MIRILVFPCASGVGQEIYNALLHHKDVEVFGANAGVLNPGSIMYGYSYIGNMPPMGEKDQCIRWLNNIIETRAIDCIFPAYDDAHVWLKTNEHSLPSVKIITSPFETTELCRSKKRTYERFDSVIRCPRLYESIDSIISYPIFIKPECGEGSKGCYCIRSEEELRNKITPDHILLEYLPGEEYTVDCFTDASGQLLFVGPRVRKLTRAGISILTESCEDREKEFSTMATAINSTIRCIGAWFFQVKRSTTGQLALLEIAPRIAGAMCLYRAQGINFPLLSIYAHMGKPTTIIQPRFNSVVGCKLYTNHFHIPTFLTNPIVAFYVDLDDTLLEGGTCVNVNTVSLLYEAKNAGIPSYLITRHRGIVDETLDRFCIHKGLFQSIIHITDSSSKLNSIVYTPAIFLDDSFSERRAVDCDGIYCMDIDSYELVRDCLRASSIRHP